MTITLTSMDVLLYSASFAIIILAIFLSILIFRVIQILGPINRILKYIDHIRWLFESWEKMPVEFIKKYFNK